MGSSNVIIKIKYYFYLQCCNLINLQNTEEYNFKPGNAIQINKPIINRKERLINNNPNTNMKISDKNLLLEIQSQNQEYKKLLTITPWGIEGSSKLINYEEGCSTYFGYDSYINQVRIIINNI